MTPSSETRNYDAKTSLLRTSYAKTKPKRRLKDQITAMRAAGAFSTKKAR